MFVLLSTSDLIQSTNVDMAASYKGKHKLVVVILQTLKWPLLMPIPPRLVVMAFIYCQPLLVTRFLDYLQSDEDTNIGRGLIGAYAVVYFGIAVSCSSWYPYISNTPRSRMPSTNIICAAAGQ